MLKYCLQLETALKAARLAGDMLREEFHRLGGPRGEGGHADIDIIAEAEIHRILTGAFSDYGYRGEELGLKANPRDTGRHTWVVDPNDGTSDFLRGFRGSSVSIALLRAGRPVLGVVNAYCSPDSAGDMISWAEGCGPVRRDGAPIQRGWPRQATEESTVLVSVYADFKAELNAKAVVPMRFRGTPSIAYRLARIAVGDADASVSLNAPNAWDYGAGHALLIGAGATLADGHGRRVAYTDDGYSDCAGACYAGSETLICDLMDRDWERVKRGARDRNTPFVQPERGRAIRDPGLLSRAQGCFIGQLAGGAEADSPSGQPGPASELALVLARSMVRAHRYDPGQAARVCTLWQRSRSFERNGSGDALQHVSAIGIACTPAAAWDTAYHHASLTPANDRDAAALFAATISHAIRSGDGPESVHEWAIHEASERAAPEPLRQALLDSVREAGKVPFQNAFFQLLHASGPADSSQDSAAGALLGAVYGLRRFPWKWVDRIVTARALAGLPGVQHPRPAEYWPIDALYIAERLAAMEGV